MYKISNNIQKNNEDIDKQIIRQRNLLLNNSQSKNQKEIQNQITHQIEAHYQNNYHINYNNNLQYIQQDELINDITKMHLLPPICPLKPNSYTEFYNDNAKLYGVSPYHLQVQKHKKDSKPKINLQYNNFYSNFKTDSLKYNTPPMDEYDSNYNTNNEKNKNNTNNTNNTNNENIKIYKETKNQKDYAVPMKSNGSNKLETLYNDCLNKPTFEYKKFGYDMVTHKNNSHLVDNPLFNIDISKETDLLYTNYMESREQNASNIYSAVFEDMYILGYNPHEINDL